MEQQTFKALLDKYVNGTASEPEWQLVEALYDELSAGDGSELTAEDRVLLAKVGRNLSELTREKAKVVPFYKRWAVAAAAVVVIAAGAGYLLLNKGSDSNAVVAKAEVTAPVINKARITLGNGKTIYLDSVASGQTISVDGVQLTKLDDGKIVYGGEAGAMAYNTASNPRGSTVIDLELSDHSHVWLNAGSSITYPVSFNGNERRVTIEGEAYFEVAHNAQKPFVVAKGDLAVQVLGTHFNVKAYAGESDVKVTLLEGSVRVNSDSSKLVLKPNQQAVVKAKKIALVAVADIEEALAWKNGYTSFHSADMATVLAELSRWYDVDIEVKEGVNLHAGVAFYFDVKRSAPLRDLLKGAFANNNINYTLNEGEKKLTIFP